jgi:hypothetical protein
MKTYIVFANEGEWDDAHSYPIYISNDAASAEEVKRRAEARVGMMRNKYTEEQRIELQKEFSEWCGDRDEIDFYSDPLLPAHLKEYIDYDYWKWNNHNTFHIQEMENDVLNEDFL